MTGKNIPGTDAFDDSQSWLPQVGTSADCNAYGPIRKPRYHAVYQLFNNAKPYNEGPKDFDLPLDDLEPGDLVSASVTNLGEDDGSLKFHVQIVVVHNGVAQIRETDLPKPGSPPIPPSVKVDDAASQGGCILEGQDDTTFVHSGLATFNKDEGSKANFTECTVNGNGLDTYPTINLHQWNMKTNGDPLATPGSLGQNGAFPVTRND